MKLYFESSDGKRRIVAKPKTEEEAIEIIHAFCKERKFEIYYTRTWRNDKGEKVYDVGSWSEFFYLVDK